MKPLRDMTDETLNSLLGSYETEIQTMQATYGRLNREKCRRVLADDTRTIDTDYNEGLLLANAILDPEDNVDRGYTPLPNGY